MSGSLGSELGVGFKTMPEESDGSLDSKMVVPGGSLDIEMGAVFTGPKCLFFDAGFEFGGLQIDSKYMSYIKQS